MKQSRPAEDFPLHLSECYPLATKREECSPPPGTLLTPFLMRFCIFAPMKMKKALKIRRIRPSMSVCLDQSQAASMNVAYDKPGEKYSSVDQIEKYRCLYKV